MSETLYAITYPRMDIQYLFGPRCLNFPALAPHIPAVFLSAIFFQITYSFIGPLVHYLLMPPDPKVPYTKLSRHHYSDHIVSITQSCVNSAMGIYLLAHPEFRELLTAQERILGYHPQTARVLAISMGYFVFHLGESWVHKHIYGRIMVVHAVCVLSAIMLGFKPLSLHYSAGFLIWEIPNLFLNIQRQLDNHGLREHWFRAANKLILLFTYAIFRLGFGTMSISDMARDMLVTWLDPKPRIGAEHVLPSLVSVTRGESQEVGRLPAFLALVQLVSMMLLHIQGFYWFSKIVAKGDLLRKEKS